MKNRFAKDPSSYEQYMQKIDAKVKHEVLSGFFVIGVFLFCLGNVLQYMPF